MSARAGAEVDTTVWREVGAPLVAATADGPLGGRTVAVKDLFAVAGYAIGAGVDDFLAERAPETDHAAVVAELLAAGADIAGIARTDEFAYSITGGNGRTGMPVNPAAPQRIPGGSSSGPAVAVARGEADIGLGTDTAGSIRVPGSYQGLWGIRTTHAALDTTGLLPLAPSFDAIGWLARDAATLAAVADVLLGPPRRPASGFGTVGDPWPQLLVDPALCAAAQPQTAERCLRAARGIGAEPIAPWAELDRWFGAFRLVQAYEAWAGHGTWITAHPGALEAEVADRFAWAATVTAEDAAAARLVVAEAAARIRAVVGDRVLVLPSTAGPPPYRDADRSTHEAMRTATLRLTCLASIAGLPAVTLPLPNQRDLPTGLCLLGAPHSDRALIRTAARCAAALTDSAR
ncbi:amidase family protein [Nocardia sp. NPDC058176]|uniref:amidase family protein n=1 Tax=Nocardia sp. NPDC058176 TaxID=3346368 RepID=UPI0036DBD732